MFLVDNDNTVILLEEESSSSSYSSIWQQRIISLVTSSSGGGGGTDDGGNPYLVDFYDNISYQCSGYDNGFPSSSSPSSSFTQCPENNKPLWWTVLQWLKMMLMKIAITYHGKPFLLAIGPLLVGLLIGYFLGNSSSNRRRQRRQRRQINTYDDKTTFNDNISQKWGVVKDFISLVTLSIVNYFQYDCSTGIETTTTTTTRRENQVRTNLKSDRGTKSESGLDSSQVPRHVAVIMDGNRRYGKLKYGNATQGHWDGSSKLVEFAKWCIAEKISFLTVYAFSTENWDRDPTEVTSLMSIFVKYCDELRVEALERNIKIIVLSTEAARVRQRSLLLLLNELKY